MEVIYLTHPYQENQISQEDCVLALGFFDGVHKAHQSVIQETIHQARKKNCLAAVMSFDHHPSVIFGGKTAEELTYLSPLKRKIEVLEKMGVDIFYVVTFDLPFATLSPQDFVNQYIVGLHAKMIVAGFDYTYGKKDIANMECLPLYAKERFEIIMIPEQQLLGGKISSTNIRQALQTGDMEEVNDLLGYVYEFGGIVEKGFGRGGKLLGYPTANLAVPSDVMLPAMGVYITQAYVDGVWYPGMASIGMNPTFPDVEHLMVEIHVIGINQDLYGDYVNVRWHKFLRPEIKFNSIQELIDQLHQDKEDTLQYFG